MAQEKVSMRKIREILRLKTDCGLGHRAIGRSVGLSHSTVAECLQRAQTAGLSWPLAEGLDEERLSALLYPPPPAPATRRLILPTWAHIHQELRRPHVTLQLLWEEYRQAQPDGYGYSRFCELFGEWARCLSPSMRQTHKAGDKCFVDYAGPTVPVIDPQTGEVRDAALFVGVLGASSYTYAEAHFGQDLRHWTTAHVRMFAFFGGSSRVLVPDNLKSGVKDPCFYEPNLNPTYAALAAHYGCAVLPARPNRPRDKAKVEAAVLVAERWILARLRDRTFFALSELNAGIAEHRDALNHRPMRHLGFSRAQLFERLDRPALQPLPERPYEFALRKSVRVNIDHHVEVEGHWYSVHHSLIGQTLEARATAGTVELFRHGHRVASHARSYQKGGYTTLAEHRPAHHQFAQWPPERLQRWAATLGPQTAALVTRILASRTYPEQAYRTCLGILRLGKTVGPARLEAACQRAQHLGIRSCKGVKSILDHQLDSQPLDPPALPACGPHEQVRGHHYYE